jgi:hypothetical protein
MTSLAKVTAGAVTADHDGHAVDAFSGRCGSKRAGRRTFGRLLADRQQRHPPEPRSDSDSAETTGTN